MAEGVAAAEALVQETIIAQSIRPTSAALIVLVIARAAGGLPRSPPQAYSSASPWPGSGRSRPPGGSGRRSRRQTRLDARDRRFADPDDNPGYFAMQAYLAARRLNNLLGAGRGDPWPTEHIAVGFSLDALAPTNFLPTNPAAIKKAFETGGATCPPASAISSTASARTGDGRARSTRHRSSWAATWRQPRTGASQ